VETKETPSVSTWSPKGSKEPSKDWPNPAIPGDMIDPAAVFEAGSLRGTANGQMGKAARRS
jgi:hypothetical protein